MYQDYLWPEIITDKELWKTANQQPADKRETVKMDSYHNKETYWIHQQDWTANGIQWVLKSEGVQE